MRWQVNFILTRSDVCENKERGKKESVKLESPDHLLQVFTISIHCFWIILLNKYLPDQSTHAWEYMSVLRNLCEQSNQS